MIQRIQTVYMALVVILYGLYIFFPIAQFDINAFKCTFDLLGVSNNQGFPLDFNVNTLPLLISIPAIGLLILVNIFFYHKRPFQMRLCNLGILLNGALLLVIFWYADSIEKGLLVNSENFHYHVGTFIPLVSIILLFLASRSIKKDEALVKSTERLR